jgi:hypothetical protein
MARCWTVGATTLLVMSAGCASTPDTGGQGVSSSGTTGTNAQGSSGTQAGQSGNSATSGSGDQNASSGTAIQNPGSGSSTSGSSSGAGSSGTAASGAAGSGTGDDEGGAPSEASAPPSKSSCPALDAITDYESAGPFKYDAKVAGSVKMWVPQMPAGCKIPMVHLANGTGATCADYQDDLNRLASHGFLALCYEDTNTGAGTQGIQAFDAAISMFPNLVDTKIGSTGHSQGGQAAFTVLQLAEAKYGYGKYTFAGLAMEPASGFGTQPSGGTWEQIYAKIQSPMFMFSGTADMLVSAAWVGEAYSAMNPKNEVYWWSATGATHIPTPQVPEEQVSIPWFRWKLLGDNAACKFFKAMPGNTAINPGWTKSMSENEAPCK